MLVAIPAVGLGLFAVDFSGFFFGGVCRTFLISPREENERAEDGQQSTYTAYKQRKNVEQASASSGNQCVLGHRFVPRFGLFASDNSTNGGGAIFYVLAQMASVNISGFEQDKHYAVGH